MPGQKPVSAATKPLGSVLLLFRQILSAQDGATQKFEKVQNRLEISFLDMFKKILLLSVARTATGNMCRLHFVEPGCH
jgi:hypothetical protein